MKLHPMDDGETLVDLKDYRAIAIDDMVIDALK